MVHALEEVWRVLHAGGWMVDLRPVSTDWPLDVVTGSTPARAGTVDGSKSLDDQEASDAAIETMLVRGLFVREKHLFFELAYYWPSLEAMEAYAAETWTNSADLPDTTLEEARRLATSAGLPSEIRVLRQMEIARYRRVRP